MPHLNSQQKLQYQTALLLKWSILRSNPKGSQAYNVALDEIENATKFISDGLLKYFQDGDKRPPDIGVLSLRPLWCTPIALQGDQHSDSQPDMEASQTMPPTQERPAGDPLSRIPLDIVVAPSGFKECLEAEEVAESIAAGIHRAMPEARIHKIPLHDGGEGFAQALTKAKGGELKEILVTGPINHPVKAHVGFFNQDGKTAVLDMSSAAGLRHVPISRRDPTVTTTYGVGQLILFALEQECDRIIVGCGDSGTCDGKGPAAPIQG